MLLRCALAAAVALPGLAAPTFHQDIQPIIYRYCAPCHRPGEAGPFPLLTYTDAKKRAAQIAAVTAKRFMPPWLPEPGHGDFADELRLSDAQIRAIADWAAAGAPEGDPSHAPPPPIFTEGWQLGPPDLILEPERAANIPASGPDVYWNFIFTANTKQTRWVRAIEIRPGEKRAVHHANLYVDRAHSARAAGEVFPGMDPKIERSIYEPDDGHFLYWKPGGIPYSEPDGLSWRLDPGDDLVLNAHILPTGKPEAIRPVIGLYFTEKRQTKFPMLIQLEHDGALNIPAGDKDFLDSDDFTLPLDVDVLAIYPHAHALGHVLEGYATLPDGTKKWLIRIPDWDRNWEAVYRYRAPVFLPRGTVISMRFHYDNSSANPRNPNHPPKLVKAGNRLRDEMGHLWLQVLPRGGRDLRLELEEALVRHWLEKYPGDFLGHLHLGGILLARLDPRSAETELQRAVSIDPKNPEGRNMLGSALLALGRTSEAIDQFRLAIQARPDYQNARYNLARALIKAQRWDEALAFYQQIVAAYPRDVQARNGLGELLYHQGRYAEAIAEFEKALSIDPTNQVARQDLEIARRKQ